MSPKIVNHPFQLVHELLAVHPSVGFISELTTSPPSTFRWLNKKNSYVNLGLEKISETSCQVCTNNNSYEVPECDLEDAYQAILRIVPQTAVTPAAAASVVAIDTPVSSKKGRPKGSKNKPKLGASDGTQETASDLEAATVQPNAQEERGTEPEPDGPSAA